MTASKPKTAELSTLLEQYDYAETITRTIGDLTVTLAEAHSRRNPEFAAMMFMMIAAAKAAGEKVTEDQEIDCFAATLLKSWNLTEKGKAVPVGEPAAAVLKRNQASRNLYRELSGLAAAHSLFKAQPSKKKPSSKPTTKRSKSATSRKRSSPNAKSANGRLPKESNATSIQ